MTWKPDYATLAELKSYLRIQHTDDDVFLALWVTATSRNVDDFCHRQFGQVAAPEARTYPSVWDRHQAKYIVEIDDLMTTVGLTVAAASTGAAVTAYKLGPANALLKGKPYEQLTTTAVGGDLVVTASWGWTPGSAGPTQAKAGLLLQAARLAARRDSPFGIAGSPTVPGSSEIRLLAQLDPDFRTTLAPFRREWWTA